MAARDWARHLQSLTGGSTSSVNIDRSTVNTDRAQVGTEGPGQGSDMGRFGPIRTCVGWLGGPRGGAGLLLGSSPRVWLTVHRQAGSSGPKARFMVVQVHFLLPRSMAHVKPVHHAAVPPFLLLLCFPMESPAGGELTPPGDLVAQRHGHRALRVRGVVASTPVGSKTAAGAPGVRRQRRGGSRRWPRCVVGQGEVFLPIW